MDWPWFSALAWWQKAMIALTLFVVFLSLGLLPRTATEIFVFSGTAINVLIGFLRAYVNRDEPSED